jgi:hypothetical protein
VNCADVAAFLFIPESAPQDVVEHLEGCESCRAQTAESRRVAALVSSLPAMSDQAIAGKVMARIGYGNGRPTREKILDQLKLVRDEFETVAANVRPDELHWRPSDEEPTIAEIIEHLPATEELLASGAMDDDTSGAKNTQDVQSQDLRRVRERTLRFVEGLADADLGYSRAEALRAIYRHEADHAAQISDVVWRARRRTQLGA